MLKIIHYSFLLARSSQTQTHAPTERKMQFLRTSTNGSLFLAVQARSISVPMVQCIPTPQLETTISIVVYVLCKTVASHYRIIILCNWLWLNFIIQLLAEDVYCIFSFNCNKFDLATHSLRAPPVWVVVRSSPESESIELTNVALLHE